MKFNDQVSQEAAEWFIEFRTGDVDAAARQVFDAWVRSSQEHLRAYLEIAALWNECNALDARRVWDTEALVSLADENVVPLSVRNADDLVVQQPRASAQTAVCRRRRPRWLALAASIAFLACASTALLWLHVHRSPTYATEVGEQRSIRLSDGSTVELNSRSRVRIGFTDTERGVELLEGQALFQVAKNAVRPFIVRSDGTRVRAVGTRFDVNRKPGGTVVTVVEGKVAVAHSGGDHRVLGAFDSERKPDASSPTDAGGQETQLRAMHDAILLSAGEQLTLTPQGVPAPIRVNTATATAWTQRQLVLESAPLAEVAAEFNRYSRRRLVVEDSAATELRLSGVFEADPDFLIRYLRDRSDITVRETDTEILIIRRE